MFNIKINVMVAGAAFILSFFLGLISGSVLPMLVIRPVIFAVIFFIVFACIQILINRFLPELLESRGTADNTDFMPGTRINITEADPMATPMDYAGNGMQDMSQEANQETGSEASEVKSLNVQPSFGARPNELDKEIGDISQLAYISKPTSQAAETGIDQKEESGYTGGGEEDVPEFEQVESFESNETPEPVAEKTEPAPASEMPEFFFGNSGKSSSADEVLPDLDSMAGAFSSASSNDEPESSEYPVSMSIANTTSGRSDIGWSEDFPPKDIASGVRTILNKDKEA